MDSKTSSIILMSKYIKSGSTWAVLVSSSSAPTTRAPGKVRAGKGRGRGGGRGGRGSGAVTEHPTLDSLDADMEQWRKDKSAAPVADDAEMDVADVAL